MIWASHDRAPRIAARPREGVRQLARRHASCARWLCASISVSGAVFFWPWGYNALSIRTEKEFGWWRTECRSGGWSLYLIEKLHSSNHSIGLLDEKTKRDYKPNGKLWASARLQWTAIVVQNIQHRNAQSDKIPSSYRTRTSVFTGTMVSRNPTTVSSQLSALVSAPPFQSWYTYQNYNQITAFRFCWEQLNSHGWGQSTVVSWWYANCFCSRTGNLK